MGNNSSVKRTAGFLKFVSALAMLVSIVIFIMGALFVVINLIAGTAELSSSDAVSDAIMQFFFDKTYYETFKDFISVFYAYVLGSFISIFVFAFLSGYFKKVKLNSDWYFDGAKKSLIKVLVSSTAWFALPLAVSVHVMSSVSPKLFDNLRSNINVAALIIIVLMFIALVKCKNHNIKVNSEAEEQTTWQQ
ncbi:MAG: hypothetical protein NC122_05650 [Faecalibacterium sp.]|nr:hypothetical protein [Ruminococcus sp.]MCM1391200.1 hypothetical protein [Ruminococcus sp.]MCM1485672.1 hypothetical protein [Faecalibacterium sp.]